MFTHTHTSTNIRPNTQRYKKHLFPHKHNVYVKMHKVPKQSHVTALYDFSFQSNSNSHVCMNLTEIRRRKKKLFQILLQEHLTFLEIKCQVQYQNLFFLFFFFFKNNSYKGFLTTKEKQNAKQTLSAVRI